MTAEKEGGGEDQGVKKLDKYEALIWHFFSTTGYNKKFKFSSSFIFDHISFSGPNYSKEDVEYIKNYLDFLNMPYPEALKEIEDALTRLVGRKVLKIVTGRKVPKQQDDIHFATNPYRAVFYKLF